MNKLCFTRVVDQTQGFLHPVLIYVGLMYSIDRVHAHNKFRHTQTVLCINPFACLFKENKQEENKSTHIHIRGKEKMSRRERIPR